MRIRKPASSRPRGRPPKEGVTMHQIAIRLPEPMLEAIDGLTTGRLDQPDRSTTIRELIAEAIEARKRVKK